MKLPQTTAAKVDFLDRTGLLLSTICLIHCTVLPLALALLQAWSASLVPGFAHNESFHLVFAVVLLGVGGIAFVQGFRKHGQWLPLFGGLFGTILLFWGALNPGSYFTDFGEHGITIAGTLVLIASHIKNRRALAHTCVVDCCAGHPHLA